MFCERTRTYVTRELTSLARGYWCVSTTAVAELIVVEKADHLGAGEDYRTIAVDVVSGWAVVVVNVIVGIAGADAHIAQRAVCVDATRQPVPSGDGHGREGA